MGCPKIENVNSGSILNELRKQTQSLEEIAKRLPPPQVK
jgi:hypothetical protein